MRGGRHAKSLHAPDAGARQAIPDKEHPPDQWAEGFEAGLNSALRSIVDVKPQSRRQGSRQTILQEHARQGALKIRQMVSGEWAARAVDVLPFRLKAPGGCAVGAILRNTRAARPRSADARKCHAPPGSGAEAVDHRSDPITRL